MVGKLITHCLLKFFRWGREVKRVIVLVGIVFLLGLSGCNDNDDESAETEVGECRLMFS